MTVASGWRTIASHLPLATNHWRFSMPKYQVLQPIEKNNVMYVAQGAAAKLLPSACHGKLIPVDASGEIELSEEEAAILVHGQVPLFQSKPDPVGGAEIREQ